MEVYDPVQPGFVLGTQLYFRYSKILFNVILNTCFISLQMKKHHCRRYDGPKFRRACGDQWRAANTSGRHRGGGPAPHAVAAHVLRLRAQEAVLRSAPRAGQACSIGETNGELSDG